MSPPQLFDHRPFWKRIPAVLLLLTAGLCSGGDRFSAETPVATPLQDDAQLHDVHLVGEKLLWAVGDHGAIWHSADGGSHWEIQRSPVDCSLRAVWFLNRKLGWAVGGRTEGFTHQSRGVVLHTTDGGAHWNVLEPGSAHIESASASATHGAEEPGSEISPETEAATRTADSPGSDQGPADASNGRTFEFRIEGPGTVRGPAADGADSDVSTVSRLPRLRRVRFLTSELGLVTGQPTTECASGVFLTRDGGKSWAPVAGEVGEEWLGADFANLDAGVLVGQRGTAARVREGSVDSSRRPAIGGRGLYDSVLTDSQSGWAVGDGALILQTTNGGLVWQAAPGALPADARRVFDFRAVAARGKNVWVAGEPGSVVWHSADGGETWRTQSTGQTLPITGLGFSDEHHGCAVGALGLILRTDDGGETWTIVRGGGRRLAYWQLFGHSVRVRLIVPTELSGEQGYRGGVEVVSREDLGQSERLSRDLWQRLTEATTRAGGSTSTVCWQFPLGFPGLDRNFEKLRADWNRRNENQLEQVLTGHLVRQIRMWRPSIVVLDRATEDDAVTRLVNELALKSIEIAADSTQALEQLELAGLDAWRVSRVFEQLTDGSQGAVEIERHRPLPRLGSSNTAAAVHSESLVFEQPPTFPERLAWRMLRSEAATGHPGRIAGGFLGGLPGGPVSAIRRSLPPVDEERLAEVERRARKQRVMASVTDRALTDDRKSAQLIAEIPQTVRDLPEEQGAHLLANLAEKYVDSGRWELAELTLIELAQRYPEQPAGRDAMRRLVQWWSSGELAWRRLRPAGRRTNQLVGTPRAAAEAIGLALARLEQQSRKGRQTLFDDDDEAGDRSTDAGSGPVRLAGATAPLVDLGERVTRDYREQTRFWHAQAARVARELQRRDPQLAREPAVQLPMVALYRAEGLFERADLLFLRDAGDVSSLAWRRAAQSEMWLTNRIAPPDFPTAACALAAVPPELDGLLSELCWQQADEIPLRSPLKSDSSSPQGLIFVCCDAEYLYVAGSLPRARGVRRDGPDGRPRRHDEALEDFDRITLFLDVDRDYHTGYAMSIDQRGCTSDNCLGDSSWNPRWFVKVVADETHWRFETAIPWEELTPVPPGAGTGWLLGCVRTIPATGIASWAHPAAPAPRPECYGLLRFE